MKLALGSAQFGLSYGISNHVGKVSSEDLKAILGYCADNSIDLIDTAMAYGDAEVRLGSCGIASFHIVTKIPRVPDGVTDVNNWVKSKFFSSLKKLNVKKIYAVLMHSPNQLLEPIGVSVYETLCELRDAGLISKIGISTYDPVECRRLTKSFSFSIAQVPLNIIDRRFYESGCIELMAAAGIEVHVRSIYLQGLLLMSKESIPSQFNVWKDFFATWTKWIEERGMTASQGCLAFANQIPGIERVVVGVESLKQISEINISHPEFQLIDFPSIKDPSQQLINPSRWKME